MKKYLSLAAVLVMLFSVSLVANAEESPKGEVVVEEPVVEAVSPKTGESDIMLYGLGAAAVVLATGAVVAKRKEMEA